LFRADLHCHTNCSDGTLTPVEVVRLAKEIGLSALSITDHDSVNAYETALPAAKEAGLLLGTGVEFSSYHLGRSVHLLGYNYSLESPELHAFCAKHHERRRQRNLAILAKLGARGIVIKEEELVGKTIGRPHIAALMIKKGFVSTIKEAFNLYIGDDCSCFVSGVQISTAETIGVIHRAGGKAFLAHPHLLNNGSLLKELLKLPFDGIECHYARCQPAQEKRWIKIAQERGYLMSGGSDFHGAVKPDIPLGCSWVGEESFFAIFDKLKKSDT
jgi:3',5'-nucleoside bisphosphate phosphatase